MGDKLTTSGGANPITPSGQVVIGIVIVWFVLGVLVTLAAPTLSAPSDAYAKWTNQLIGVLGAAIGARVLWKLPETLQIWANNHKTK